MRGWSFAHPPAAEEAGLAGVAGPGVDLHPHTPSTSAAATTTLPRGLDDPPHDAAVADVDLLHPDIVAAVGDVADRLKPAPVDGPAHGTVGVEPAADGRRARVGRKISWRQAPALSHAITPVVTRRVAPADDAALAERDGVADPAPRRRGRR